MADFLARPGFELLQGFIVVYGLVLAVGLLIEWYYFGARED